MSIQWLRQRPEDILPGFVDLQHQHAFMSFSACAYRYSPLVSNTQVSIIGNFVPNTAALTQIFDTQFCNVQTQSHSASD